jgi:hypothetical protein
MHLALDGLAYFCGASAGNIQKTNLKKLPTRVDTNTQNAMLAYWLRFLKTHLAMQQEGKALSESVTTSITRLDQVIADSAFPNAAHYISAEMERNAPGPYEAYMVKLLKTVIDTSDRSTVERIYRYSTREDVKDASPYVGLLLDYTDGVVAYHENGRRRPVNPAADYPKIAREVPKDRHSMIITRMIWWVEQQGPVAAAGKQTETQKAVTSRADTLLIRAKMPEISKALISRLKATESAESAAALHAVLDKMQDQLDLAMIKDLIAHAAADRPNAAVCMKLSLDALEKRAGVSMKKGQKAGFNTLATKLSSAERKSLMSAWATFLRINLEKQRDKKPVSDEMQTQMARVEQFVAQSDFPEAGDYLTAEVERHRVGPVAERFAVLTAKVDVSRSHSAYDRLFRFAERGDVDRTMAVSLLVDYVNGLVLPPKAGVRKNPSTAQLNTLPIVFPDNHQDRVLNQLLKWFEAYAPREAEGKLDETETLVHKRVMMIFEHSRLPQIPGKLTGLLSKHREGEVEAELISLIRKHMVNLDNKDRRVLFQHAVHDGKLRGPAMQLALESLEHLAILPAAPTTGGKSEEQLARISARLGASDQENIANALVACIKMKAEGKSDDKKLNAIYGRAESVAVKSRLPQIYPKVRAEFVAKPVEASAYVWLNLLSQMNERAPELSDGDQRHMIDSCVKYIDKYAEEKGGPARIGMKYADSILLHGRMPQVDEYLFNRLKDGNTSKVAASKFASMLTKLGNRVDDSILRQIKDLSAKEKKDQAPHYALFVKLAKDLDRYITKPE